MSTVIPVPFLSLYTPKMLENAVCGLEELDLTLLKKVVRYVLLLRGDVYNCSYLLINVQI